ncbi:class I SAM-dependent methyltransferase, partial [Micromonospora zhanjiangensis]
VRGYADRIPAADAALDHVVSSLALHHVDDDGRTAFARDALRALRPGGRVTVVDFGGPAPDVEQAGHQTHAPGHNPVHAIRRLVRPMRSRVASSPVVARNHGDAIVALLAGAGFGDAREVAHTDHRFGRVTFVQATRPTN